MVQTNSYKNLLVAASCSTFAVVVMLFVTAKAKNETVEFVSLVAVVVLALSSIQLWKKYINCRLEQEKSSKDQS